jgi:hypothetical protein
MFGLGTMVQEGVHTGVTVSVRFGASGDVVVADAGATIRASNTTAPSGRAKIAIEDRNRREIMKVMGDK